MLTLPEFDFIAPQTVPEAVELLAKHGDRAKILAGGTDLIPSMKNRLFEPDVLISLGKIPDLNRIKEDDSGITLGAMVPISEVAHHPIVVGQVAVLAEAAQKIATPLLQNKGTIGGNILLDTRCFYYNQSYFWRKAINNCMKKDGDICRVAPSGHRCYAISSCDTVPVLVALNATIKLVSEKKERVIDLKDFYVNDGMAFNKLQPGELLTEVFVPRPPKGFRGGYMKLRRRQAIDYPMLGVMIGLTLDDQEVCKDARIVLGAIFSSPFEVEAAGEALIGKKITEKDIEKAAELAYEAAKPLDLTNFRPAYRKRMVRVFTRRLLQKLTNPSSYAEEFAA
ncbi:MAG: FAD binding domain-containing protein [Bacteroidetes bacterium]|nr:FAD binding domain-containing protein [Bacteroidota bacterium]